MNNFMCEVKLILNYHKIIIIGNCIHKVKILTIKKLKLNYIQSQ